MATLTKTPRRKPHAPVSEDPARSDIRAGSPLPLGTQESGGGVNFAIFSRYASRVRLELFARPEDAAPARTIDLDPARNRTGDVWHAWIRGVRHGQLYAYRVDGPYQPKDGHRFNFHRLLLDPFATAISRLPPWDFASARGYDPSSPEQDLALSKLDNSGSMPKCVFVNEPFEWAGDQLPRHPWSETVIYEMHVRGFTIHPKSGVDHPGTYRGLVEKIPYLKTLGVTAVELMPVQEFNETSVTRRNPQTNQALKNYWGYDPVVFCAPKASYSGAGGLGQQKTEFKEMVRALHHAGIEVILDVVFNHTAEGNELGPTLCFRGIDNAIFYTLADDKRHYKDYTGTGNTINANNPEVREQILASLRYWRSEMHVDGFRFDLASVLVWIHDTAFGALVKDVTWMFPTFQAVHLVGMTLLVGVIGVIDLRVLGLAKGLPLAALHRLIPLALIGFAINLVTGFGFFAAEPYSFAAVPAFRLKLLLIVLAGLNALWFWISIYPHVHEWGPDTEAPALAKGISLISLGLWLGVIFAGRFIAFGGTGSL